MWWTALGLLERCSWRGLARVGEGINDGWVVMPWLGETRDGTASFVLCCLAHRTDMRWTALIMMEKRSWGGPVCVGQGIDDGWAVMLWLGKRCSWSVNVIACIVSNERALNEIWDSPSGSPASRVFPLVLKSPRRVRRRVISTPGARTCWCMCCAYACGSSWCFCTVWGVELVKGQFVLSESPTNALMGWRGWACVRDVGGERQEESIRVGTE